MNRHETPSKGTPSVEKSVKTEAEPSAKNWEGLALERLEQEREKQEMINVLNAAEVLMGQGDEETADRRAGDAWARVKYVLDAETLGREFAKAGFFDLLASRMDGLPDEKRLAIAYAALENGALETIFLKNKSSFPGIDERQLVIRAAKRKAGFHLQKFAEELTLDREVIVGLLTGYGDERGAKAWAERP